MSNGDDALLPIIRDVSASTSIAIRHDSCLVCYQIHYREPSLGPADTGRGQTTTNGRVTDICPPPLFQSGVMSSTAWGMAAEQYRQLLQHQHRPDDDEVGASS